MVRIGFDMLTVCAMAAAIAAGTKSVSAFDCMPTECPQLTSCAEARYKLYVCGHSERDADNDGIPCETLCGKDRATFESRSLAQWPKDMPFAGLPKSRTLELVPPAQAEPQAPRAFSCAGKRKCGDMDSCDEAQFYLRSCGATSLDRDRDGTACNALCGR